MWITLKLPIRKGRVNICINYAANKGNVGVSAEIKLLLVNITQSANICLPVLLLICISSVFIVLYMWMQTLCKHSTLPNYILSLLKHYTTYPCAEFMYASLYRNNYNVPTHSALSVLVWLTWHLSITTDHLVYVDRQGFYSSKTFTKHRTYKFPSPAKEGSVGYRNFLCFSRLRSSNV